MKYLITMFGVLVCTTGLMADVIHKMKNSLGGISGYTTLLDGGNLDVFLWVLEAVRQ